MIKRALLFSIAVFFSFTAWSLEISGVHIPGQLNEGQQDMLVLNGAGIRKKLFFKIYVAALYLKSKSRDASQIINADEPSRITMDVTYSEITDEKMANAWLDGFKQNLSSGDYESVRNSLEKFIAMFGGLKEGDHVELDYFPEKGTKVSINQDVRGTIAGHEFNRGLLSVWLGEHPVTEDLKQALLGR